MTDPILEITSHLGTDQLVSKANDEIRALCLGPHQKGGRRWTLCVPVQLDDSDVVLAAALRRLQVELREERELMGTRCDRFHQVTLEHHATVEQLTRQRDKLASFKAYVHQRLTDAGVPEDPDPSENHRTGCRIGLRLTWLFDQLEAARAAAKAST